MYDKGDVQSGSPLRDQQVNLYVFLTGTTMGAVMQVMVYTLSLGSIKSRLFRISLRL